MGKRFVSIWFRHLATDWFTLRQPELQKLPFVLTVPSHGRMVITAANFLAQKKGIRMGMALADARALVPALKNFDDKPGVGLQLLQRIAEWCIHYTPVAATDGADGILLDASGCTHLWGGDEAYVADIVKRISDKGFTASAAIADTVGVAWAMARFGNGNKVVASGAQAEALLNLPPAALRLDGAVSERLNKLGLHQIKDFFFMQRSALRRRFGAGILLRLDQAMGKEEEIIRGIYPLEPYQERLPCPEPITTRKGIEIALERLLTGLCNRLKKEGKGLRHAFFRGFGTDSSVEQIEIGTNRASHHEEHLYRLFELKIETMKPGAGIELFVLEATKVEDHSPSQETMWKETGGLNDSLLAELIDRFSSKLGAHVLHRYLPVEHHLPERSIKKTASLQEAPATDWQQHQRRPLQLLAPPHPIEVTAPIPDYPPMNFRYKNKLHKVVKADGPERIEQEWWIEEGAHRDYYSVEDEAGCRYWLFRLGHYDAVKKPQWFLHGFLA